MLSTLQRLVPFFGRNQKQSRAGVARNSPALIDDENGQNLSDIWTTVSRGEGERQVRPQKSKLGESSTQLRYKGEYVINEDISNGRERFKIPALSYKANDSDPRDFHYVTEHMQSNPLHMDLSFSNMSGCECTDDCADGTCHCASNHRMSRCYNPKGRLNSHYNLESPEMIYECNASCKCNKRSCQNRVIQNGCQVRLVLFRTGSRGWGIRTLETLKRGTFIGVYSGELVSAHDSTKRNDDTYLFNLALTSVIYQSSGVTQTNTNGFGAIDNNEVDSQANENFVCDAKFYGNFTRFINHSCEPNVIGIRSFTEHHDSRFPYIAFFTNQDIPANTELTLNYGDNYWLVKCKRDNVFCRCRQTSCRFNKKTFPQTFKQHQNEQRKKRK